MTDEYRIQADFIVIDSTTIIPRGQLLVRAGRIAELIDSPKQTAQLDLGGRTILPGFINSHTHLEFSDLQAPIPTGRNFPEWIAAVISHRRKNLQALSDKQLQLKRIQDVARGLHECRQSGTVALVDIVTEPWDPGAFAKELNEITGTSQLLTDSKLDHQFIDLTGDSSGENYLLPRIIALPEVIGLDNARLGLTLNWALNQAELYSSTNHSEEPNRSASRRPDCKLVDRVGVSPHAPYSIAHPQAIQQLSHMNKNIVVAMHVAESHDELQWLSSGTGAFQELYHRIGLPTEQPRMQIDDAIDFLAQFPSSLLIHGNYLTNSQLDRIADSQIAIVYCPRTHQHFGHSPYPLAGIIDRRIPLLLGTDSRASNPDLNIWSECKQARRNHRDWSPAEILKSITSRPAERLGIENDFGSLKPGRRAAFNTFRTPPSATVENLLERLMDQ